MHKVYAWYIYVCAFVCESTGTHSKCQRTTVEVWSQSLASTLGVCTVLSVHLYSLVALGSPGRHGNWPSAAEPSQAPRWLHDSHHPFRNSFSPCSSSWLGTSYVDQTDLTQGVTCLPLLVSAGITVCSTNYSCYPPASPSSLAQGLPSPAFPFPPH